MTPAINVIIPKTITATRSETAEKNKRREMLDRRRNFQWPGRGRMHVNEGHTSIGFHASKEIAPNHRRYRADLDASFERPQMVTISDFLRV